jgi:peptide/nickel transport system permease protein
MSTLTAPADAVIAAGSSREEPQPQSYWNLVWLQFRKNQLAFLSSVTILLLLLLAIWAPVLANGRPFIWTELKTDSAGGHLETTYPLLQYLVAPSDGGSIDYFFNYLFFLSLLSPIVIALSRSILKSKHIDRPRRQRRTLMLCGAAVLLAFVPFISPGFQERATTPEERKANPDLKTVSKFHFLRPWRLDKRDYVSDRALLDSAKGERAVFPAIAQDPITPTPKVLSAPDSEHLLGTDFQGRDVLARLLHGARISLSVGFVAVGISLLIGVIVGGLAGYYRGWVDIVISRIIEVVICFPSFFLIITVIAFIEDRSIFNVMLVIGFTGWTGFARMVRGEFLKLSQQDFVTSARALGCGAARTMFVHILPNALGPVLVLTAFGVASAVLTESGLSYLGFGAPPPTPTWGEMISQGKTYIDEAWWLLTYPGFMIFLTVTVYNLAGDGLRDAMDPKMRR